MKPVPAPGRRYTVDAAAKALELLGTFSFTERRLSLSVLASRTGIPRATAFRLLSTLESSGYITKVGVEYQLGVKCFVLGNIVAADLDLKDVAHPHLVRLRDATRETTHLAILDDWQVVYLEHLPSPQPVGFMRSRVGAIVPAYCTGLGKTLLAYRPAGDVVAWAALRTFPSLTPRTITAAKRLMKELGAIRTRGYALDDEEHELGVRCIAAPVRNHEGTVVAAISVAGPTDRMPRTLAGSAVAAAVVAAAHAISVDLGAGAIGLGAHSAPASRGPQRAVSARWGGRKRSGAFRGEGAPGSNDDKRRGAQQRVIRAERPAPRATEPGCGAEPHVSSYKAAQPAHGGRR